MPLPTADWHQRFKQQAQWTQDLRAYLYPRVELADASKILDLGCGTGALMGELHTRSNGAVFGVDIHNAHLRLAQHNVSQPLTLGDAHELPYADGTFDITLCHFTLMWLKTPAQSLREMTRVTRPGGTVLALAEPDYDGRIDYPTELEQLGKWQIESLRRQGADPLIGRRLASLFTAAGLNNVETGLLGGQWNKPPSNQDWETEWQVLESDLSKTPRDSKTLRVLRSLDKSAWERGERVLFVPTFYAWGRVPKSGR
ncbi:MAG: methyltransferase domain-containing protein [Chloroflexota bacterium]|nr:methyltransferase domain-containing protein [Chloroflexota bacterium]